MKALLHLSTIQVCEKALLRLATIQVCEKALLRLATKKVCDKALLHLATIQVCVKALLHLATIQVCMEAVLYHSAGLVENITSARNCEKKDLLSIKLLFSVFTFITTYSHTKGVCV